VGLERGPLSLVSTTEELLGRKNSCSGLERREYGRMGAVTPTTWHSLTAKVGANFDDKLKSLVAIVPSRTRTTEFSFLFLFIVFKGVLDGDPTAMFVTNEIPTNTFRNYCRSTID
jgi:hypothetical protein